MKADRDAADDAQAPRELPLVDPTHEAPACGQGGVPDRFLGHLYLTLLPGGPILVPPILASGQSIAVAYFAEL